MMGYMYILECADGSYYTGSTTDIEFRIEQHQNGEGANHTKKRLPVRLIYFEVFQRIDEAFYREKQIQGWRREKKEALINSFQEKLPELSLAYRDIIKRWLRLRKLSELSHRKESLSHREKNLEYGVTRGLRLSKYHSHQPPFTRGLRL